MNIRWMCAAGNSCLALQLEMREVEVSQKSIGMFFSLKGGKAHKLWPNSISRSRLSLNLLLREP
jgi:hypothetical protein